MRHHKTFHDLRRELIFDNFAGGGGASVGIEQALGRSPDHAINHDPEALGMHRINHPETVHHCEDIWDVDPALVAMGDPIGFSWFSPDCKHFSKAKGGLPLDKEIRGLVLVMLRYAAIGTRVMAMENVEEIQTWGPLLQHPKHKPECECGIPCGRIDPAQKGRTWRAFLDCLSTGISPNHPDLAEILDLMKHTLTREQLVRGFGYKFEYRELRGCNYSAPTIRKRLFLICRCDDRPIVWPEPSHAKPDTGSPLPAWPPVADCIDWSLPCPSIFINGKAARRQKCKRPLKPNTLRRIAAGVDRYILKAKRPFFVNLTHQGGDRVESVDEPGKTITGAHRGEKAVVDAAITPFITEHANATHQRNFSANEPGRTQCAQVKGGHFGLVAPLLSRQFGQSVGQDVRASAPTIMPGGQGKTALVSGVLVGAGGPARAGEPRPLDKSMHTLLARNDNHLAAVHLTKFNTGSTGSPADAPSPTIVAGTHSPETRGGAASTLGLVAASLLKFRGHPDSHPNPPLTDPGHTVTAGANHEGLAMGYLAQQNAGNNTNFGHPATEPMSTLSSKGAQQQVVTASVGVYYGSEKDGQHPDEPLRSVTSKPRFNLTEARAAAPALTDEQLRGAIRVAQFLRKYGVKFDGPFATVGEYIIWDIGMRMLAARELFRAQGFPEGYIIDAAYLVHPKTGEVQRVKLTKEAQIRMCGNSVCPPVAKAIVAANVPELCTPSLSYSYSKP